MPRAVAHTGAGDGHHPPLPPPPPRPEQTGSGSDQAICELGVISNFEEAVVSFVTFFEFDTGCPATLWNSQVFSESFF